MDDKMLINLVKEHPILYNSSHQHYMDVGMKVTVWKEIGAQMNTDGERCKQRWNNIRDNYKKSLKKLMQQKSMKPYRFAWQLSFLKKYMDEREPKGNQNLPTSEYKISEDEECECESQSQPEVIDEEETTHEDTNSVTTPGCEVVISVPTTQSGSIRKRKLVRESASSVLMKYLLEKKSTQGTTIQGQPTVNIEHPVDAFLFALSPSLKSLPPHLLMLAKSEIFACVQKYERKWHSSKGSSSTAMNKMDMEASLEDEEEQKFLVELGTTEQRTSIGECPIPRSSQTAIEPPSKRRKESDTIPSQNDLLKLACEFLSSCKQPDETNDEYQGITNLWTLKLKGLIPTQKRLAERAINEILFEAVSGTLHRNSVQINYFSDPNLATPHSSDPSAIGSNSAMGSQPPVMRHTLNSHSSTPFNNTVSFSKTELDVTFP